jgi:hypothetical protein
MNNSTAYDLAIDKFINERYGPVGADNFFGGKLKKKISSIAHNAVSLKKRKVINSLKALASREGKDIADVALKVVKNELPTVRKYVLSKGEVPLKNVAELATQAHLLRQGDIKKISDRLNVPHRDAEAVLEHAEAELLNDNNGDSDEFLGAIAGAIGEAAKKGLAKLAEKKKDKNGLFAKAVKSVNAEVNGGATSEGPAQPEPEGEKKGIGGFFSSLFNKIKDEEKKKEIKKMLPTIIIGLVLFAVIIWYVARVTKK